MPEVVTSEEYVNGLRALADFYAANPEMPVPSWRSVSVDLWKKEDFVKAIRTMAHGGLVEKRTDSAKDILANHHAIRQFGAVQLDVRISKSQVCQKVRKMVEMDVWECPDSLLDEG